MPRFSILTPVHLWNIDRVDWFLRCIESIKDQTFKDFEWIVVDDGSTVTDFNWSLVVAAHSSVKLIHKEHEERVIAYNEAFKEAQGDWFVLLDSDDELKPNALEKLDQVITKYPNEKMFNFGAVYVSKEGKMTYRDPFFIERKAVGHKKFGGGNIVNGTFVWHRSIYEDLGGYPKSHFENIDCSPINYGGIRELHMNTPYDFSAEAQLEFPEIREYFMVDHENEPHKIIKELGNPWGQDYYLYYKYTRKYHSRIFKEYLYIVYPR